MASTSIGADESMHTALQTASAVVRRSAHRHQIEPTPAPYNLKCLAGQRGSEWVIYSLDMKSIEQVLLFVCSFCFCTFY